MAEKTDAQKSQYVVELGFKAGFLTLSPELFALLQRMHSVSMFCTWCCIFFPNAALGQCVLEAKGGTHACTSGCGQVKPNQSDCGSAFISFSPFLFSLNILNTFSVKSLCNRFIFEHMPDFSFKSQSQMQQVSLLIAFIC